MSATQESSVFSVDGKFWNRKNLCLNMGRQLNQPCQSYILMHVSDAVKIFCKLCVKSCLKVLTVYGNTQVKTKYFKDV